jgi:hypothetical protein
MTLDDAFRVDFHRMKFLRRRSDIKKIVAGGRSRGVQAASAHSKAYIAGPLILYTVLINFWRYSIALRVIYLGSSAWTSSVSDLRA